MRSSRPRRFPLFLVVTGVASLLAGGCGPTVATVRFADPADQAPAYGAVPFPSDANMEGGRIGVIPDLRRAVPLETAALQAHLSALDGFGTRPVVEVFLDGPVEADSLADGLHIIGVSDGPDAETEMPFVWRLDAERNVAVGAVERGCVLEERTRYAVVATDGLRGKGGRVGRAPGFEALLAAEPAALPERWRSTREAVDVASRVYGQSHLLGVGAFTVQSARAPLLAARTVLERLPAPTLRFDDAALIFDGPERLRALMGDAPRDDDGNEKLGWSWGTGMAHEHVGLIATGELSGVTFRRPDAGGVGGYGPDSGTFDLARDGTPHIIGDEHIPITLMLPQAPPPPGGYPVALFGHGLGASRAQMLAFVETAARAGWAMVAIDASGHGSRFDDTDEHSNVAGLFGSFTGDASLRDGFGDTEGVGTSLALFHDMRNVAAMRDEMRQSVLDLSQVVLALRSGGLDLSALKAGAHVDGDHLAYLGESFGGVLGATFMAIEPHVRGYFLDVPGGGVLDMAACHSPVLRSMIELFLPSLYGVDADKLDRFHPLIGFGSAILDGADPLAYARHVLRDRPRVDGNRLPPRHVAIVMVVGDEVLPNSATIALAKALGMPVLAPKIGRFGLDVVRGTVAGNVLGQTAVLMEVAPATHGENWTSHLGHHRFAPFGIDDTSFTSLDQVVEIQNPIEETHQVVRRFLDDLAAGDVPRMTVGPVPRRDFDSDGVLDSDDDTPWGE